MKTIQTKNGEIKIDEDVYKIIKGATIQTKNSQSLVYAWISHIEKKVKRRKYVFICPLCEKKPSRCRTLCANCYPVVKRRGELWKYPKKRTVGIKYSPISLHHFVLKVIDGKKFPKGYMTDHINHDGLDNRRQNLRIVTNRINQLNGRRRKWKRKYKGIELPVGIYHYGSKTYTSNPLKTKPFVVRVGTNHKIINLGCFATLQEAITIRKKYIEKELTPS